MSPGSTIDYRDLLEGPCPLCDSKSFSLVTIRFDSGRIVRCAECGHTYLNPTLTDEMLSAIYQSYHASEDDSLLMETVEAWFRDAKGPYQYALDFVERWGGFGGKRVLEVGCGPARFLHECRGRGAHVSGVDISPGAVRLAKQRFNMEVICQAVEDAMGNGRLRRSAFNMVFAFEVVEHVKKPGSFVEALYELLEPGGLLFVSTPNFHLFHFMGGAAPAVSQWVEHIHFFDPLSLANLIRRHNFEIVVHTTLNPLTYGDRLKQVFVTIPSVNRIWRRLRGIPPLYSAKEMIFRLLDKHKTEGDAKAWNGTCVMLIGKKITKASAA